MRAREVQTARRHARCPFVGSRAGAKRLWVAVLAIVALLGVARPATARRMSQSPWKRYRDVNLTLSGLHFGIDRDLSYPSGTFLSVEYFDRYALGVEVSAEFAPVYEDFLRDPSLLCEPVETDNSYGHESESCGRILKVKALGGIGVRLVYRWLFMSALEVVARAGFEVRWTELNEQQPVPMISSHGDEWKRIDIDKSVSPSASIGLGLVVWHWRPSIEFGLLHYPAFSLAEGIAVKEAYQARIMFRLVSWWVGF